MIRGPFRGRDYGGVITFLLVIVILIFVFGELRPVAGNLRLPSFGVQRSQRAELIESLVEPTPTREPSPAAAGAAAADAPSVSVTATPAPTPTPAREIRKVGNTGGVGVYLRRTPDIGDRMRAWVDGSDMELLGEEIEAGGFRWIKVRDPAGNEGWIPERYLVAP